MRLDHGRKILVRHFERPQFQSMFTHTVFWALLYVQSLGGIYVTSFSVFHTEATVKITENGLRYARGPIHFPNHPLHL